MIVERLYIPEIQIALRYRRTVSVRRWCHNNGVRILCDFGSNKQFVLKDEFENAINNSHDAIDLSIKKTSQNNKAEKAKEYKPQGEYEKNFLNCLQNF
jgi:hypothetical protein